MAIHVAAARDNYALKSFVQNVHRGMRCVACSAILLEPHVIGIHIIHFRPQEVAYHRSVALAVDVDNVLKEVRTDDSARPKSASNSDFLGMHLELVYLAWIGIVPNSIILLVHISIHPKIGLIAKNDLAKFGLTSNCSRTQSTNTRRCLWSFTLSSWVS